MLTPTNHRQYPVILLTGLLVFCCVISIVAQPNKHYTDSLNSLHINFEKLRTLPPAERQGTAKNIYNPYRKTDSVTAMAKLDELTMLAQEIKDKSLEDYVFNLRADYFSVNRGFNPVAISFYQKAIDFAVENNMPVEEGEHLHRKGLYYSNFKQNAEACLYFLQSQEKFKEIGFDKVPNIAFYQSQVAEFYYSLGELETAKNLLLSALKYNIPGSRDRINITNTIGLIYRSNKQYTDATRYFDDALALARKFKDSTWIGIAQGNIGSVYFLQDDYDKAMPYLVTDYRESARYGENGNAAIALLRIVKINLDRSNFAAAQKQLDTAELLVKDRVGVLNTQANIYDLKAQVYERLGLFQESVRYRKMLESAKDSIAKRDNIAAVDRMILKWETDKRQEQLDKLKTESELEALKRNGVIATLVLLIIIFAQLYNKRLLRAKKDKALLQLEKRRVDEELGNATEALQHFTDNLKEKNDLIEHFKDEIEKANERTAGQEHEEYMEQLMQEHIMTDKSWDDFKKLFMKVHGGFLAKIKNDYPNLSETDIRMLALMKLGLNKREMANMLGINMDSLKKGKQRLRKKMGLAVEADIEELVAEM